MNDESIRSSLGLTIFLVDSKSNQLLLSVHLISMSLCSAPAFDHQAKELQSSIATNRFCPRQFLFFLSTRHAAFYIDVQRLTDSRSEGERWLTYWSIVFVETLTYFRRKLCWWWFDRSKTRLNTIFPRCMDTNERERAGKRCGSVNSNLTIIIDRKFLPLFDACVMIDSCRE